jgi:hypothetical protein
LLTFAAVLAIAGGSIGYKVVSVGATAGQILKLVTSDGGSTFYVGRCFRTDIKVQTDTLNANSVDVIIGYNPTYVQPYTGSGCTIAATAINTTGIFGSYPSNTIAGTTAATGRDSWWAVPGVGVISSICHGDRGHDTCHRCTCGGAAAATTRKTYSRSW